MKVTITIEDGGTVTTASERAGTALGEHDAGGSTNGALGTEPTARDAGGVPEALLAMAEEVAAGERPMPGSA